MSVLRLEWWLIAVGLLFAGIGLAMGILEHGTDRMIALSAAGWGGGTVILAADLSRRPRLPGERDVLRTVTLDGRNVPAFVLRPDRRRTAAFLLGGLGLAQLGVVLAVFPAEFTGPPAVIRAAGILGAAFFGLVIGSLLRGAYLAMVPAGILLPRLRGGLLVGWNEIERVGVFASRAQQLVGVRILGIRFATAVRSRLSLPRRVFFRVRRRLSGWDASWTEAYVGIPPEALAAALRRYIDHPAHRLGIGTANAWRELLEAL